MGWLGSSWQEMGLDEEGEWAKGLQVLKGLRSLELRSLVLKGLALE